MGQDTSADRQANAVKWSEFAIKWLAISATLIGSYITFSQLVDARTKEVAAARREYEKPFYEKQFDVYLRATQHASILATSMDTGARKEAHRRFRELLWGEMCIFEDKMILDKMHAFEDQLVQHGPNFTPKTQKELESLKVKSAALAFACRQSLATAWPVPKGEIKVRVSPQVVDVFPPG